MTNGAGDPARLRQVIWNYDHSEGYVERVLFIAASYAAAPAGAGGAVVRVEPYRWANYLGATRPTLGAPRPIPTP